MPAVLLVTRKGVNQDDIVTGQIDSLVFPFAGAFTGKPADGLTETVLVQSSTNSELVDSITASMNGEQILKDFKATGVQYAVAVRLTGKFKTAFPEGKPAAEPPPSADERPSRPTNDGRSSRNPPPTPPSFSWPTATFWPTHVCFNRGTSGAFASPSRSTATSTSSSMPSSNWPATTI